MELRRFDTPLCLQTVKKAEERKENEVASFSFSSWRAKLRLNFANEEISFYVL